MSRSPVAELNDHSDVAQRRTIKHQNIHRDLLRCVRECLKPLITDLFSHTDDALFERADRSHSNAGQQLYFESMRQIRLERDDLIRSFHQAVADGANKLKNGDSSPKDPTADDTDFDEVSLVQQDELEISVAISGIVSKITSQHSLAIMQLTKRLDHITPGVEVSEANNPFGPRQLSECFASALQRLQVDIEIHIILFKLFERSVMEQLGDLYTKSNAPLSRTRCASRSEARLPRVQQTQRRVTARACFFGTHRHAIGRPCCRW